MSTYHREYIHNEMMHYGVLICIYIYIYIYIQPHLYSLYRDINLTNS